MAEELGHAVLDTGMTRSTLAGDGIRRAKEGVNLGRVTQNLFYALILWTGSRMKSCRRCGRDLSC